MIFREVVDLDQNTSLYEQLSTHFWYVSYLASRADFVGVNCGKSISVASLTSGVDDTRMPSSGILVDAIFGFNAVWLEILRKISDQFSVSQWEDKFNQWSVVFL